MASGISHRAAVDEAPTDRTGVAHGFASVLVLQGVHDDRTSDPHRVAGDADERDETRTGCLPAVGAETIAHEARLPPGFIAHCAAQTSTCPGPITHAATIGPGSSLGKFERRCDSCSIAGSIHGADRLFLSGFSATDGDRPVKGQP